MGVQSCQCAGLVLSPCLATLPVGAPSIRAGGAARGLKSKEKHGTSLELCLKARKGSYLHGVV